MKEHIKVSEVMTTAIRTVKRTATVQEAIDTMRTESVSSLVVERRNEHDEYGLVGVTDIARDVMARDRAPERVNVYEVMSKPVITVHGDMDIKYAMRLLTKYHISRALVIDDRRDPMGIVTLRDMVFRAE